MAIVSWRITCNFVANKGVTFVEGRVHFEHAASREEAESKTRSYLESQHYTDIVITDCHEETWEEKYRKLPKHPALKAEETPLLPKAPESPPTAVASDDSGELF